MLPEVVGGWGPGFGYHPRRGDGAAVNRVDPAMIRSCNSLFLLVLVGCLTLAPAAGAGPGTALAAPVPGHPRIGLVLSGGGARGAAHVGVLKVLEELRIPISAVVGTSMGALVGGTYAAGMSPAEMERRLTSADWDRIFTDDPPRADWPIRRKQQTLVPNFDFTVGVGAKGLRLPTGALAGQEVEMFFSNLVANADTVRDFDALTIPFRAVATDLENGAMRVFAAGPLPEVMRASMSVPGVFAPVHLDGHVYVDGGLVRNLPVDVARRLGVDLVIAVNLGSSYLPREELDSVVGVLGQMVAILTEQNVQRSLQSLHRGRDVLISPDLGKMSSGDFTQAARAIRIGVAAARAAAPRLRHLSLSPQEWEAWKASRPRLTPDRAPIEVVEIKGLTWVNPALFGPLKAQQLGRALDRPRLEADIARIYGRGDFQNINFDLEPGRPYSGAPPGGAGVNRLVINAREKPWGPGYLSAGLGLSTDLLGTTRFGLHGDYRRTWVNALGAEWYSAVQLGDPLYLYTEFYQPFSLARTGFVVPNAGVMSYGVGVYDSKGARIADYDVTRTRLGIDLGTTICGGNAELRVGAVLASVSARLETGDPTALPNPKRTENGLRAQFVYDTLDSAYLPRRGQRLEVDLASPRRILGASYQFNRLSGHWTLAASRGRHTLVARAVGGAAVDSDMPYYDQFAQGGFLNLSGYETDRFRGNRAGLGSLTYSYRIASLMPPLGRGVYLGGSLEIGVIADTDPQFTKPGTRFGSSLFIGADTWLGPAYLALGYAGDGSTAGYLILGRP